MFALAAISSPGRALGLDAMPMPAAEATITAPVRAINPPAPGSVPNSALPTTPDATTPSPDEVRVTAPAATAPGEAAYASLADAVADQDTAGSADDQLACLAGAVYFESKGEPLSGQLAVANVILNRTTSGRFPGSICGVVRQPGQFSFLRDGEMPSIRAGAQYRTALAVARVAMDKDWANPTPGALYFHARRVSPGWGRARVATIGNHIFYR